MEVNRENMCVILVDEGMVDDHLPNHVLGALRDCKTRFMSSPETYDSEEIKELRKRNEHLLCTIRRVKPDKPVRHDTGFQFGGESPMKEPVGGPGLGSTGRHSHLKKQRSFDIDGEELLHPPITGQRSVGMVSQSGLSRISECADEDAVFESTEKGDGALVTVRAEVSEGVVIEMENRDHNLHTHTEKTDYFDSGTELGNTTFSESETAFKDTSMKLTLPLSSEVVSSL